MADNQGVGPVVPFGERGAKAGGSVDDAGFGFFLRRPPDIFDAREIVCGPRLLQLRPGAADIAGVGEALAHDRIDGDRYPKRGGDRMGGLQGAGVGGHDDALDSLSHKLLGGLFRLGVPERGEAGIDNAGIAAGGAEMQVELALAVTQQNHAAAIQMRGSRGKCDI